LEDRPGIIQKPHRIVLACIMVLAGSAVRLWYPADQQFGTDEVVALLLGHDWLKHPGIVYHGMYSGGGVSNPPISIYLFAGVFKLSSGNPETACLTVIGLNILGIALAAWWLLIRSTWLPLFWAWWVVAALCFNPWMVIYSGDILAQSLLLPFVVVAVGGLAGFLRETPFYPRVLIGIVSLAILSQIHMSGILWTVGLVAGVILFWPGGPRRHKLLFLGSLAGVLLAAYLPWLIYITKTRPAYVQGASADGVMRIFWDLVKALGAVWAGTSYGQFHCFFTAEEAHAFYTRLGLLWRAHQYLSYFVSAVAVVASLTALRRFSQFSTRERLMASLILGMMAIPLLATVIKARACPHYAIVAFFPTMLLMAYGMGRAQEWLRSRTLRLGLKALAILMLAGQLWTTSAFLQTIHAHGGTKGDFGDTLHVQKERVLKIRGVRMSDFRTQPGMNRIESVYLKDYYSDGRINAIETTPEHRGF